MQLHFGTQDYLIGKEDARKLISLLRYNKYTPDVYWQEDYAHLDYIWSVNARDDIYERVMEFIDSPSQDEV